MHDVDASWAVVQEPVPDWDEEERLRQSLAVVQAENIKLQREYEEMANTILHMVRVRHCWGIAAWPTTVSLALQSVLMREWHGLKDSSNPVM
jgi:hypothetical protein